MVKQVEIIGLLGALLRVQMVKGLAHPRFFDQQLCSAVGAIVYASVSGNGLLTSIPL